MDADGKFLDEGENGAMVTKIIPPGGLHQEKEEDKDDHYEGGTKDEDRFAFEGGDHEGQPGAKQQPVNGNA